MSLQEIINEARLLSLAERRELIKMLVDTLATPEIESPRPKHSILELRGLGKEIWQNIDVQDYLNHSRGDAEPPTS